MAEFPHIVQSARKEPTFVPLDVIEDHELIGSFQIPKRLHNGGEEDADADDPGEGLVFIPSMRTLTGIE